MRCPALPFAVRRRGQHAVGLRPAVRNGHAGRRLSDATGRDKEPTELRDAAAAPSSNAPPKDASQPSEGDQPQPRFYSSRGEAVSGAAAASPDHAGNTPRDAPRRKPAGRRRIDPATGAAGTIVGAAAHIAVPFAVPVSQHPIGPQTLAELIRAAGPPVPPDDFARRMVAAGTEAPADPAYPVADATWEELRALLAALTDDALVGLRVVERLPSVSSGIVCLSAPYKGAELYLRHLARRAAASIGADFLAVWTHDIFPRLPPLAVLQSKPEQEGGRGRSKRGRDQQFMGPPGANIMITGLMGGPGGRFNVIGGGGGGDDGASEDGPITPYPWFRPYVGPQGDMAPLPTGRSPGPHQPAHHLNDGFASFFNLLSHTSPAGTKRPRPGRSVLTGERLPAHLPPLVVYYEDLAEVLRLAEEGETLSAADVVGGLAQAVGSVRRGENGRNVVVLVPHTRTFASPGGGKGDESAMFFGGGGPGVKAIRKFNLKDEEEEEDEDPSSGSGLPGIFGMSRKRPVSFDTPLDRYIGVPRVDVLPPPFPTPGALTTQARPSFPRFSKLLRQDLARVVSEWNERELRAAARAAGAEMPAPLGELTEAVLADLPGGKDGERGRRMIFQERCLTMPEIEKVVAMAMGARAAPAGPPTPLPEEGEPPAARVKATGLAAVRAQTVDAADVGKFLRIGAEASLLREAARSGAGGEHAEAFADPAERLKIDQYEERILRECFVKPSRMDASFATIGGIAKTKRIVQELIQLPLQRPELFGTGILKQTTTGILLFGPPGTGKTLLARAVAAEAGANFLNVQMSHLQHMYVGENEKHTRALFTLARKLRPCVVFVDEIDSLLKSRRNGLPSYASNTINEFMAEWDGIQSENRGVIVVGCTNRPFDLDEAVLRRMPRRIMVDLPDEAERREILGILLRDETIGDGPEERADIIAAVAKRTESFSGSDLKNLSIAAAMNSIREQILGRPEHATDRILRFTHFERALEDGDVVPSVNERNEVIKELKAWDKQYGSGAGGYRGHSTIGFL